MDLKFTILCLATVLLLATSLVYGVKFLRKQNYLLGLEWLVVTLSTSNLLIYLLSQAKLPYSISYFCDAFSRAFGIPVIATAGLMAVTHRYAPSKFLDIVFFAGSIAGTAFLVSADIMAKPLPYFYLFMWTAFSIYLAYFAYRLLRAGENRHALGVILALVSGQAIASIYDFYKIPGDEEQVIFFTLALTTWSYMLAQLYYAYGALERVEAA
ncbi:hypothetical protein [Noviherbaspirillum sp.]|uniref:hypothetical protein n=1 Tax=Noviherbaspirillum sp. TaxID=1926288 RepID=UPI002D630400|nr:hypothetical protein [Noviherbaspirillum sp.]HZW20287.1 hypothetical protein [Noviherbaspirillum sp.]